MVRSGAKARRDARAPARGQLRQHHLAAGPHRHRGADDHEGVGTRSARPRGGPRARRFSSSGAWVTGFVGVETQIMTASTPPAGSAATDVEPVASKRGECLPPRRARRGARGPRESAASTRGRGVHAVDGEALAGQDHRHGETDVAHAHHADGVHADASPAALRRCRGRPCAGRRGGPRRASTRGSGTRRPGRSRSRQARIRSVASKCCPRGISSMSDGIEQIDPGVDRELFSRLLLHPADAGRPAG